MSNRRVTLGPVTTSQMNARAGLGDGPSGLGSKGTRRMSVGPTSRMSMGVPGMGLGQQQQNQQPQHTSKEAAATTTAGQPSGPSRQSIGATATAPAARRASVGVSRKSSFGMPGHRGSTVETKRVIDTRNIGDKAFMNASIRALIQYLTEHGFDHAISSKILTRPAVKDFHNIVMFLFKQLDPNLHCTGKFEDEVVSVFKHLGYPVQISKANIAAVGSPHAWPSLLAAIMWLIELLAYDEAASAGAAEQLEVELEDPASYKAFFEYIATSYALFLSGEDASYADLEQQFVQSFEGKNVLAQQQVDALVERNVGLKREITEVENRLSYLPQVQARKNDLESDTAKFIQLIEQLQEQRDALTKKAGDREVELESLTSAVASVHDEMATLRKRISTQELSPEDVRSMVAERERLEEAQRAASEVRQAVVRKQGEAEMALRDGVQALEDTTRAYNSIAEDLKLVPHTAKNAHGKHYALVVDVHAKKGSKLVKTDVRRDIQPALTDLLHQLEQTTGEYRTDLLKEQDAAEEAELRKASLLEQRSLVEGRLRRADEAYRREKETLDQATELHNKEMEAMETRLLRLRDTASEEARSTQASRRAAEIRASREAVRAHHARTKQELMDAVMDAVSQCATHREMVQVRLGELKGAFGSRLQQLLVGDEPAPLPAAPASASASTRPPAPPSGVKASAQQNLFPEEEEEEEVIEVAKEDEDEEEEGLEGLQLQSGPDDVASGADLDAPTTRFSLLAGRASIRPHTLEEIMMHRG